MKVCVCVCVYSQFQPEKFPGLKWKMELFPGHQVTWALFERGRGVVTGLRSLDEVVACNMVVRGLPCYERGNEYRELDKHEAEAEAISQARVHSKRGNKRKALCA